MTDADWDKAQVGVASSWNEVTPCNLPLDRVDNPARFVAGDTNCCARHKTTGRLRTVS